MGTIQILTKCCNDDLEIDEDDDEKQKRPTIKQQPVLSKTKGKSTEVINDESDSFTTTIPCFPSNN